jgi:hypothetical protein
MILVVCLTDKRSDSKLKIIIIGKLQVLLSLLLRTLFPLSENVPVSISPIY